MCGGALRGATREFVDRLRIKAGSLELVRAREPMDAKTAAVKAARAVANRNNRRRMRTLLARRGIAWRPL